MNSLYPGSHSKSSTTLRIVLTISLSLAAAQVMAQSNTFPSSGNVGIWTTNPLSSLQVGDGTSGSRVRIEGTEPYALGLKLGAAGVYAWMGVTSVGNYQFSDQAGNALVTFLQNGNVGIGTTTPSAKLDVNGSINVSGNIAAKYQDVAEWVPATESMEPGTVVALNPDEPNQVMPSSQPYDTAVAGVVSAEPGLILGEAAPSKAQIATYGRVRVKVTANPEPIRIGDLLVTSGKAGIAMKSLPIEIAGRAMHQPGTIIGKALEPLPTGEGNILVLLSLQ